MCKKQKWKWKWNLKYKSGNLIWKFILKNINLFILLEHESIGRETSSNENRNHRHEKSFWRFSNDYGGKTIKW